MRVRDEKEMTGFNPGPTALKVKISGGREVTILPTPPEFGKTVIDAILRRKGFKPSADIRESLKQLPENEPAEVVSLQLWCLCAFSLNDASLCFETPEFQYPPEECDTIPASDGSTMFDHKLYEYACSVRREGLSRNGRSLLTNDDVGDIATASLGLAGKAHAEKND